MLPFFRFHSITCCCVFTHSDTFVSISLRKTGIVRLEAIAFRWCVLSIGESSSPSQHAADNKTVCNLQECLCLFPALMSPRMALFPGVSGFPLPFTKPHTIFKPKNWFCKVNRYLRGILSE